MTGPAPAALRDALGRFASGVTVVTGLVDGAPAGFTCQAFQSVSLDPPLVSVTVMRTSTTWPLLRPGGRFTVNVLAADQQHVSAQFARQGADRWSGVTWTPGPDGAPRLTGSLLVLGCTVAAELDAGDHVIVLGQVEDVVAAEHGAEPLVYYRGAYRRLLTG